MNSKAILLIERDRDMSIVFLHFLFDLHVYKLSLLILYFCLHLQVAEIVLSFEQLSLLFFQFDLVRTRWTVRSTSVWKKPIFLGGKSQFFLLENKG